MSEDYFKIERLWKEIAEMEKNIEANSLLVRVEAYDAHTKEIAELKEFVQTNQTKHLYNHKQLNELQERIKSCESALQFYKNNYGELKERIGNSITIEQLLEKLDGKKEELFRFEMPKNYSEDSGNEKSVVVKKDVVFHQHDLVPAATDSKLPLSEHLLRSRKLILEFVADLNDVWKRVVIKPIHIKNLIKKWEEKL